MRTILTVAVALLVTTAAIAQDKASQKFIIEAIQGNFAEINMGQLAEKNGHEASVITYGQTLVTDHGNANQKAQQAANAVENSSEMNVDQAVNILHQADNDMNEYCQAQEEATGESDCDDE